MAKPFARKFYSSKAWQDCRNSYANSVHHLCENCLRRGIYKPGEIVHHVIEIDPVTINRPEVALSFDNLEMVCRDCHAEIHRDKYTSKGRVRGSDRYEIGENGAVKAR